MGVGRGAFIFCPFLFWRGGLAPPSPYFSSRYSWGGFSSPEEFVLLLVLWASGCEERAGVAVDLSDKCIWWREASLGLFLISSWAKGGLASREGNK